MRRSRPGAALRPGAATRRLTAARRVRARAGTPDATEGAQDLRMQAGRAAVGVPVVGVPVAPKNAVAEVAAASGGRGQRRRLELFEFFDERPPAVDPPPREGLLARCAAPVRTASVRAAASVGSSVSRVRDARVLGSPAAAVALVPLFLAMLAAAVFRWGRRAPAAGLMALPEREAGPAVADPPAATDADAGAPAGLGGDDVPALVMDSARESLEAAAAATKDAWMELRARWILPLAGHTTGAGAADAAAARAEAEAVEEYDAVGAAARALEARLWILSWRSRRVDCLVEADGCRGKDFELLAYGAELEAVSCLEGEDARAAAGIAHPRCEADGAAAEQRIAAWSGLLSGASPGGEAAGHINRAVEAWARCAQAWVDAAPAEEEPVEEVEEEEVEEGPAAAEPAQRAGVLAGLLSRTKTAGKDAALAIRVERADAEGAERTIAAEEAAATREFGDPIADFRNWLKTK